MSATICLKTKPPIRFGPLTPSRSDKLCPASANNDAEFIHNPAAPFDIVNPTLLARPDSHLERRLSGAINRHVPPTQQCDFCPSIKSATRQGVHELFGTFRMIMPMSMKYPVIMPMSMSMSIMVIYMARVLLTTFILWSLTTRSNPSGHHPNIIHETTTPIYRRPISSCRMM